MQASTIRERYASQLSGPTGLLPRAGLLTRACAEELKVDLCPCFSSPELFRNIRQALFLAPCLDVINLSSMKCRTVNECCRGNATATAMATPRNQGPMCTCDSYCIQWLSLGRHTKSKLTRVVTLCSEDLSVKRAFGQAHQEFWRSCLNNWVNSPNSRNNSEDILVDASS